MKHMCESVPMTNWGRVYYTNFIALFPLVLVLPMLNEQDKLAKVRSGVRAAHMHGMGGWVGGWLTRVSCIE